MNILNDGDVFEMEAKHLKPGMHIIRNNKEVELWEVDYSPDQDCATVDICFHFIGEYGEEDNQAYYDYYSPDEIVKAIH